MLEIFPVVVAVLLMQVTPGPNMMAVTAVALGSGRRAGVLTAAGVASGVLVWAMLFAFGAGALIKIFPEAVTAMKLLGGGYLLYLGLRALRAAWRGGAGSAAAASVAATGRRAYFTGLFVVLTNPKAALMWVAISLLLASAHPTGIQFLAVGLCCTVSAMLVYGTYAVMFSTGLATRAYKRIYRGVEAAFGAIFGVFGARLVADGIRELRT